MANSTLHPGKPSAAIVKLRQAAAREMDKPGLNIVSYRQPDFDLEHDEMNTEMGDANGRMAPDYSVSDNPDVGNGRGPIG